MTTPSKITLEQAKERMREYIREQTYRGSSNLMRHRACGEEIRIVPAYLSIHNTAFPGCGGAGRVQMVPMPFCPKCEPPPARFGCIHIAGEAIPLILGEPTE